MRDIRNTRARQPELQVIRLDHRPMPENKNRTTEREYRRMLRKAAFAFSVSLGVNIAQAIMIYILQVGAI